MEINPCFSFSLCGNCNLWLNLVVVTAFSLWIIAFLSIFLKRSSEKCFVDSTKADSTCALRLPDRARAAFILCRFAIFCTYWLVVFQQNMKFRNSERDKYKTLPIPPHRDASLAASAQQARQPFIANGMVRPVDRYYRDDRQVSHFDAFLAFFVL